jgi:glycosyltransferase involved in cell wall biosynthesis
MLANEHVNRKMAGPSIRCYELSRALHEAGHMVTLGSPFPSDLNDSAFEIVTYDDGSLRTLVARADVIVLQGWVMERFPWIRDAGARIVVDLYDPFPLEVLVLFDRYPMEKRLETHRDAVRAVGDQLRRGDFFMCASEKQLDYWSGWLTAEGRFNPYTYGADASLRSLIDVVPFGLPSRPPVKKRSAIRESFPGIAADDVVLLWGGGIYNWFDPVTLIRATAAALRSQPNLRLVFMSTGHPNPDIQPMWTLTEARRVSEELGLTGRHVFFNDSWVPYDEREDWLLDADIGVSTHFDHIETRFSFRTRVLDYFWAGLPVICTAGDTLAATIREKQLGLTVPPEDVAAGAAGIERLVGDRALRTQCSERVREHARSLTWRAMAQPLIRYCGGGTRAADHAADATSTASAGTPRAPQPGGASLRGNAGILARLLRLTRQKY